MLSVLPMGVYVALVLAFVDRGRDWRGAVVGAATVWGVVAVLLTELLSSTRALTPSGLTAAWLAVGGAVVFYLKRRRRASTPAPRAAPRAASPRWRAIGPDDGSLALLAGTGVVMFLVGLTAVVSPPNTWDAMQYHMPRLVHWLEQRSVAFYPAHDLRQLHMNPGAEFLRLQLHALAGGDRLDNLVQWGAYAASVVGISRVAKALGAGVAGQVLAAVMVATLPQGILQASGAKNEWVLTVWMVALTDFLLDFRHRQSTALALATGAALGLACVTKPTAYLLAPPVAVAVVLTWPRPVMRSFAQRLPLTLGVAALLVSGHSVRNLDLYGSPFGPPSESAEGEYKYTSDTWTVSAVLGTVIRNIGLHLGTPSATVNAGMTAGLERVMGAFGADPNDPRTTWTGTTFRIPDVSRRESLAGNPVHLALICLTIVLLTHRRWRRGAPHAAAYALGSTVAFLLFCAVLRWQPWHARLHLPLFVLWAAPAAVVLGRAWPRAMRWAVGPLLLCLSIPFVLGNASRPLAWPGERSILARERTEMYFAERPEIMGSVLGAVHTVRDLGCRDVGLPASRGQHYEYPLLVLLGAGRAGVHVSLIGVGNVSAAYASPDRSRPCAAVCMACAWDPHEYRRVWWDGQIEVFRRASLEADGRVRLTLTGRRVRPGQTITIGLEVHNPVDGPLGELFVGVALPGRRSVRLLDQSGALGPPMAGRHGESPRGQPVSPGFSLSDPSFAVFMLPTSDEAGTRYEVFAALVRRGAAALGRVDAADVIGLDTQDVLVVR